MRHSIAWPCGVSARSGSMVEPLAARDPDLPVHEIEAGDHLGDRDARPGAACSSRGSRTSRPRRAGTRSCRRWCSRRRAATAAAASAIRRRSVRVDGHRRRLLDDLLVAPLDRALALDERDHGAVVVAEQLDLDVARPHDAALEVDGGVAERRAGLGARGPDRVEQLARRMRRRACPCRRRPRPP